MSSTKSCSALSSLHTRLEDLEYASWEKLGFLIKSIPFIIIAAAFVLLYFVIFGGEEVTSFWNQNSRWMITAAILILVLWLLYRYYKAGA